MNEIENQTLSGVSPVSGEKFPDYKNESYAQMKKKKIGSSKPNLHLKNEMISSIRPDFTEDSIIFKITDRKQKLKAFNHNTGDTVKKREFLPREKGRGAGFNEKIRNGVKDILDAYNSED